MAESPALLPVILCGGTGTRLWPLSRASYPKQYWALAENTDDTLLQLTQRRLEGLPGLGSPLLICNEDHRFIVAEQMRQIGVEPEAILLEPMGRNTAPAVCVATLRALARGDDPLLLVLAADHVIRQPEAFRDTINAGIPAAMAGRLVTFGIVPTAPETGYGYIEAAEPLSAAAPVPIERFVEKPDRERAEQFLASGRFTWNSGMFLFRASAMLAELERLVPELVSCCRAAVEQDSADLEQKVEQLNEKIGTQDVLELKVEQVENRLEKMEKLLEKTVAERTRELRTSEKKARDRFENAVIGLYHCDTEGRLRSVNPEMARMLGYETSEEFLAEIKTIDQIDSSAPAGSVTTQEVKMVPITRRFSEPMPRAMPTPSTAPTRVWVVEIGRPVPEASTTVVAAARVAAKPRLGVSSVMPVPTVAMTL